MRLHLGTGWAHYVEGKTPWRGLETAKGGLLMGWQWLSY